MLADGWVGVMLARVPLSLSFMHLPVQCAPLLGWLLKGRRVSIRPKLATCLPLDAALANQRARARSARGARSLTAGLDPF